MQVRIKYKSYAAAEAAYCLLPVSCKARIVTDRTPYAYLEVPEDYYDYVMRYINPDRM